MSGKSAIMYIWLIFSILHHGQLVKIVIFEPSLDTQINHAILRSSTPLPKIFIMCSSLKQNEIDDTSFFTIYGESNKPWMTLSNYMNESMHRITPLHKPRLPLSGAGVKLTGRRHDNLFQRSPRGWIR